jgi:hypothetical protein
VSVTASPAKSAFQMPWGLSGTYPDWQIDELRSPEVGVPESKDVTSAAFSQGVVEG